MEHGPAEQAEDVPDGLFGRVGNLYADCPLGGGQRIAQWRDAQFPEYVDE